MKCVFRERHTYIVDILFVSKIDVGPVDLLEAEVWSLRMHEFHDHTIILLIRMLRYTQSSECHEGTVLGGDGRQARNGPFLSLSSLHRSVSTLALDLSPTYRSSLLPMLSTRAMVKEESGGFCLWLLRQALSLPASMYPNSKWHSSSVD